MSVHFLANTCPRCKRQHFSGLGTSAGDPGCGGLSSGPCRTPRQRWHGPRGRSQERVPGDERASIVEAVNLTAFDGANIPF